MHERNDKIGAAQNLVTLDIRQFDIVVMPVEELARDVQTQTAPFLTLAGVEGLEYEWSVIRFYARPVIRKYQGVLVAVQHNLDLALARCLGLEPVKGIVEEIEKQLQKDGIRSLRDKRAIPSPRC